MTQRQRMAKIVATLGPSTSDKKVIKILFEAGADVFRMNFSHGTHEEHRARYEIVREVECSVGHPISIIADLQGPKLRIGHFVGGKIRLGEGDQFQLDHNPAPGDIQRVCLPHPELFKVMSYGNFLLLDDGKLKLEVIGNDGETITTRVVTGGILSDRKGVNVPDHVLPIPALTEKDKRDLEFALSLGVDWIALSFVQRPEDLTQARELISGRAGVLAKLEKPAALDRLEEIVKEADAVMVARGDLGVELPPERVPAVQKRILRVCSRLGKPVVVATQMLESMISLPVPTRAEASDVANAIYDGADAVMLSAESASGAYPAEAVAMMDRIISEVERDPRYREIAEIHRGDPLPTMGDAICSALRSVTHIIDARVIITYTTSGNTSLRAARERPTTPILSITPHQSTARKLALVWGVHTTVSPDVRSVEEMVTTACETALRENFVRSGDFVTIAAGMPFAKSGTTNLLRIAQVRHAAR